MKKNKPPKICVITMTHERPEYIERSFESLYKRSGEKFDHYVFDDASDINTQEMLIKLSKKYKFNLTINSTHLGIFKNFYTNILNIPDKYDYYIKIDSDIELLSDNVLTGLIDVVKDSAFSGASPRAEGIFNTERIYKEHPRVEFYNGHAILPESKLVYGCCMLFTKNSFLSCYRLTPEELTDSTEKWGVDSKLYEHALTLGNFPIIEDLSVYHIDNTYGQRVKNMEYFTQRSRWDIIDNDEVWFLKASKEIYPNILSRDILEMSKREAGDEYINFIKLCKDIIAKGLNNVVFADIDKIMIAGEKTTLDDNSVIGILAKNQIFEVFALISPDNFISTKYMPHGTTQYYINLPKWAKNNPAIVIEKTKLTIDDIEKDITIEDMPDKLLNQLNNNLGKREVKDTKPKNETKKTTK